MDKAIAAWEKSIQASPTSSAALALAEALADKGDLDGAKLLCLMTIRLDPMDEDTWIMLGRVCLSRTEYRLACEAFNQAYQLNVSSSKANYYLGLALAHLAYGDSNEPFTDRQSKFPYDVHPLYERAIYHLKFSIRNSTPPAIAWRMLGTAYARLGRFSLAKQALSESARQQPDSPHAWNNLAIVCSMRGDYETAADAANRAKELDPNNGYFIDTAGYVQLRKGNVQEAVQLFRKAVEMNPRIVEAYCNLAEAYTTLGDSQKARDNYLIVRFLAPVMTWKWSIENPSMSQQIMKWSNADRAGSKT